MVWKNFYERLCVGFILILGLVFLFMVPPFQKPDEIVHYYSSVMLASGNTSEMENRFYFFPKKMEASKIAFNFDVKFSKKLIFYKDTDQQKYPYIYSQFNFFNFLGYLPNIIGIKIGSFFQYPAMAFYLARLFSFLFFLTGLFFALKVIDKDYRFILLAYAILPMLLHQVTAINYDNLQFSLIPLIFALFIDLVKTERINFWKFILFTEFLLLFQLSKVGYYAISLLFLIILLKIIFKSQSLHKKKWLFLLLFSLLLIPIFGWGFSKAKYILNNNYQWPVFITDPLYFFQVLADTWVKKRDFYLQSFFGYFGWLDYKYDFYSYLMVFLLLTSFLFCGLRKIEKSILTKFQLIILWFTIFGLILSLAVIFYLTWTKAGSFIIDGIQGRYFFVIFPLAILAIVETVLLIGKDLSKKIFIFFIMIFIFLNTIKNIRLRYYDFSKSFLNQNELIESYQNGRKINEPYLPFNSKNILTKIIGTSYGDEIGGFEFIRFPKQDGIKISLPYKYLIMDQDCKKTYRKGYLDTDSLEKNEDHKEIIKRSLKSKGENYCLKIFPVITPTNAYYFDYIMDNSENFLARLLFIKRE